MLTNVSQNLQHHFKPSKSYEEGSKSRQPEKEENVTWFGNDDANEFTFGNSPAEDVVMHK